MTIEIREARKSDILQIANVHHKSAYKAYNDPKVMNPNLLKNFWSVKVLVEDWKGYIEEAEKDKDLISLVAVENNKVIGVLKANVAGCHEEDIFRNFNSEDKLKDFIHFKTIYIDPDHQKKGIGKKFMNHVAKIAVKTGKTNLMTLTAGNYEESPKFFKSFGAVCVGQYDLDVKEHNGSHSTNDGDIICKVWFMDSKEVLEKSTSKENNENYAKVFENKYKYYMNREDVEGTKVQPLLLPVYAMKEKRNGRR